MTEATQWPKGSDVSNSVFTLTFPLSYFFLLFGMSIGVGFTLVLFGSITSIIVLLLIYTDVIQIKPILEGCHRVLVAAFPTTYEATCRHIRKSFLVETTEPPPVKAIYLFHPHGLFITSMIFHLGSTLTDWSIPNVHGVAMHSLFHLPFFKQLISSKFISSDYGDMKTALDEGKSLGVSVGGLQETLHTTPGRIQAYVSTRKGIFQMALETGTPIVPVLTYGENEIYQVYHSEWLDAIQAFGRKHGLLLCIPTLESCLHWLSLTVAPFKTPLRTVVGPAIPVGQGKKEAQGQGQGQGQKPTDNEIAALRATYIAALRALYAKTRPDSYDPELIIL